MAQRDFKYMIGYSSVSHMGLVVMGLATMNQIGIDGAVLQMFAHGVMTALVLRHGRRPSTTRPTRATCRLQRARQADADCVVFFGLAGLASLGLPGLSGFVAEFHIFVGTFRTYPLGGRHWRIFAAMLTAVYILRMLEQSLFGPFDAEWSDIKEMTYLERGTAMLLLSFMLFMGLWPAPFVDRITETVHGAAGGVDEHG